MSDRSLAALPFIATTLWTAIVNCAGIIPPEISSLPKPSNSGPTVLIHGAGGPLGSLAVRLFSLWGWKIIATIKSEQSKEFLLKQKNVQIIETDDKKQENNNNNNINNNIKVGRELPEWSSLIERSSLTLFIDCVGGISSESAGFALLKNGGSFVTLRGSIVSLTDKYGLISGSLKSANSLMKSKARFASIGVSYHWVINQPQPEALKYLSQLIDSGHNLNIPINNQKFKNIDGIKDAMKYSLKNSSQSKIIVELN